MAREPIPVYMICGFLDAGKTNFIAPMLTGEEFTEDERTLLLVCEEGEEEYDTEALGKHNVVPIFLEGKEDLTLSRMEALEAEYRPTQIVVEYTGMWQIAEAVPAFAGNCEGGDLMAGDFDVVVTDGFTGNVCLKTIEGTAKTLMRNLKAALMSTALSKVGALLVKGPLGALKEKMSPDTYGGTPLLGVKGAVIVGHGSSNETAVKNGIAVAAATVRAHVPEVIAERVAAAPASASATVGAEEKGEAAVSDAR